MQDSAQRIGVHMEPCARRPLLGLAPPERKRSREMLNLGHDAGCHQIGRRCSMRVPSMKCVAAVCFILAGLLVTLALSGCGKTDEIDARRLTNDLYVCSFDWDPQLRIMKRVPASGSYEGIIAPPVISMKSTAWGYVVVRQNSSNLYESLRLYPDGRVVSDALWTVDERGRTNELLSPRMDTTNTLRRGSAGE